MSNTVGRKASSNPYPRAAVVALCFLILYSVQCHEATYRPTANPTPSGVYASFAASDPFEFLKMCRRHYVEHVHDYRCRFIKQERINGTMSGEQHIDVLFREEPYSVDMQWVKNPGPARRVNYVVGRYVEQGRDLATIKPAGVAGLLFPAGIRRDIHGPEVRAASRRSIDQFGFKNTLDLIIKYCELGQSEPGYSLGYVGTGLLHDRPCYLIERRLPYTGEEGPYPNRLLVIYVDFEWLVPTGCFAYADDAGQELLGSYVLTNVEFNTGLNDENF
jgi:hypothetical protein